MTWNQLRHFHREPVVIATWLRFFGPILHRLTPAKRRCLLALSAIFVAIRFCFRAEKRVTRLAGIEWNNFGAVLLCACLLGFVILCYVAAKKFASLPVFARRHPQICLHSIYWALLAFVWTSLPQNPVLRALFAGAVFALPFVLWRVGYMMFTAQRGKMAGKGIRDHFFYIFPLWDGTDTPYGKGFDYLNANEARDDRALAQSQLAGIKLFLLAALWTVPLGLLTGVIFGENNVYGRTFGHSLGIVPRLGDLFANPAAYPLSISWLALYLELIWAVLTLAISGHVIIGWLRFFGFNVFRNTYKPLLAESVVEFWNRYYYYFKELLVTFFFYPTFTRYFKTLPRIRMFAAVFMAAFVGNMYYHWLGLDAALARGNFAAMWAALQSRLFYCFLLAIGIFISMLREQSRARRKLTRSSARRVLAIAGVWTFFSVIHIWAKKDPAPFVDRMRFFLGLFGFH